MELRTQDFDRFIRQQCQDIIDHSDSLMQLFDEAGYQEKAKSDRLMIQLSFSIQNLCKIVFPTPSSAEIIGMPKEATDSADDPDIIVVDKEHPNWDFKPWLQEKTNDIRLAYGGLLEYYEKDPNDLALSANAGVAAEQYIKERLGRDISTIEAYAKAILSMFESGRLMVRDIKLEEEE